MPSDMHNSDGKINIYNSYQFFLRLACYVSVKLIPGDTRLPEPCNIIDNFLQLLLVEVKFQLLCNSLEVLQLEHSFILGVDEVEHCLAPWLVEGVALYQQHGYHFLGDEGEESLEINPSAIQTSHQIPKRPVYNLILPIKTECPCRIEYIGNIALPLRIAVQVEHLVELVDMLFREDWVLRHNIFQVKGFFLLLYQLFFWLHSLGYGFLKYNDITHHIITIYSLTDSGSIVQFLLTIIINQAVKFTSPYIYNNNNPMLYSGTKMFSSPFESSSKKKRKDIDRFIPHSVSKNLYSLFEEASSTKCPKKQYDAILEENLRSTMHFGKVFSFTQEKEGKENMINVQNVNMGARILPGEKDKKMRAPIKNQPYKILEAPCLRDDFYLNLVDWSDNDNIGVGIQSSLYIWSGCTSKVRKIFESENPTDYLCSVAFMKHNNKVSVGFTDGSVKIFDLHKTKQSLQFENLHYGRVGSLGCSHNLICTGGRDGYVSIQDYRQEKQVMRYKAHSQEICGLKLNPSSEIIATGGNDNKLVLFSLKKMGKLVSWDEHQAAVKAIGFSPNEPTITSGAGTADRKLRVFSLNSLKMINEVDTGSQICNLLYSPVSNQLVTTHGYSLNQINLWKCGPNGALDKIDSMMGHKSRVLYLAGESAGGKMVTGAGDQELRLWKIFDQKTSIIPYDLR